MKQTLDRRHFTSLLASILASGALSAGNSQQNQQSPDEKTMHDMQDVPAEWAGKEHIVMLAYPGMTALDLVGPQYMFSSLMGAKVQVVAKSLAPILTDTGLTIVPDASFADVPSAVTVLFAPGGTSGTLSAMQDEETISFLKSVGAGCEYITSVCTGSLLLGKAGLLDGYRATSHWITLPLLQRVGAIPINDRVVIDRNRITGAGVSAGLDFGLQMVSDFRGADYAESVQLLCEYSPKPPLNAGSPETAKPHQVAMLKNMLAGFLEAVEQEV